MGAYNHPRPDRLLLLIGDLLPEVTVLDFDQACAREFGKVKGDLLRKGVSIPDVDLMIGTAALVHDLTLVTHNTADFQNIPGLRLEDWLAPLSPQSACGTWRGSHRLASRRFSLHSFEPRRLLPVRPPA